MTRTAPLPTQPQTVSATGHSYFFIAGAHKSGTNWIEAMLGAHPEIVVAGEAWLVGHSHSVSSWFNEERFREWAGLPTVKNRWMRDADLDAAVAEAKRVLLRTVLDRFAGPGVRWIGDRSPFFYNRDVEELHSYFPDAVYINVERDGRDVAVSHMFQLLRLREWRWFKDREQAERIREYYFDGVGDPLPLFTPETLEYFATNWRICVRGARCARELYGDSFLNFRYESLLEDPHDIRRAFERFGVRRDEEIIEACVRANTFDKKTAGRKAGEGDPRAFFRKGVSGDWRNHFTDDDRETYKQIAGNELIELGYVADNDW